MSNEEKATAETVCEHCGQPGRKSIDGDFWVHLSGFDYQICGHYFKPRQPEPQSQVVLIERLARSEGR